MSDPVGAMVYLDWNATAPPLDEVVDAMRDAARAAWGNPSSVHTAGRTARAVVESAREAVAALFDADARDVVLTGGGTEANNLALRGARGVRVIVTTRAEHPSVVKAAEASGVEVRWARVRDDGRVDVEDVARLASGVADALVAIQAVNAETGVIQPLDELAAIGARLHVDAVQAIGKIAWRPPAGATFAIAAHKFRGPKGIGALVLPPGASVDPVLRGGSQERGLRPGTVDPVAAAGLAAAARQARTSASRWADLAPLRDDLERALTALGGRPNGAGSPRAPHVTNVSFDRWQGAELVAALDLEGVCVSSGSACSAGTVEPSPVLAAMYGASDPRTTSAVRASMGDATTPGDVAHAKTAFARVLARAP